jgi:hypothetical protein
VRVAGFDNKLSVTEHFAYLSFDLTEAYQLSSTAASCVSPPWEVTFALPYCLAGIDSTSRLADLATPKS